jgi:CTP synthase
MAKQRKYIFITGGVVSSIGKGISAASIGMLMEARGLGVTMIKMDPYLNVDPGTMSPFQHGEVFVLDDGAETDLDLGHYSRFVQSARFTRKNSFTTGRIYDTVIRRERAGGYLGKTIQIIPHITDEIKAHIRAAAEGSDLAIVEVGGTVGDIEGLPFLEAIRQLKVEEGAGNVAFVHLTLVPFIAAADELKTKPTQHSVKELREIGIQPDFLICRTDRPLPREVKDKIGLFCNLAGDAVFSAVDVASIYEVPLFFHEERLDERIAERLGMWTGRPDLSKWEAMVARIRKPRGEVVIGVVGKYTDLKESYKSLNEALVHGGVANDVKVTMRYIDSEVLEKGGPEASREMASLQEVDGILVPGGFGERGVEGKIRAIEYARTQGVPFFGICLGMQLAVIEYARHVCGIAGATSEEFRPDSPDRVIEMLETQKGVTEKGGTMRLGAYRCDIVPKLQGAATHAYQAYRKEQVFERHRHRFEVSNRFRPVLEEKGLRVTGRHRLESGPELVEMIEVEQHPWFLGCQFHPEFLSRPLSPHPLFKAFVAACKDAGRAQRSLPLGRPAGSAAEGPSHASSPGASSGSGRSSLSGSKGKL